MPDYVLSISRALSVALASPIKEALFLFCVLAKSLSGVRPFATCQTPLSMGFPKQGYWRGLPFPPPGDLPRPRMSPALAGGLFISEPLGKPHPCSTDVQTEVPGDYSS